MSSAFTEPSAAGEVRPAARWSDYLELTKPRLSLLSVLTAIVGYLAARSPWDAARFGFALLGTSLCAAGVAALNQWMEADTDGKMRRTESRPLPTGRVASGSAFVLGWGLCTVGLAVLFRQVNGLSSFFALATIVSYLAFYTPAKRFSRLSTEIGAVAGAFPPLIGWAAAANSVTELGWVLFAILLFWQIPHFMAIAWTYRHDYAHVSFPMLAVRDTAGGRVAAWSLVNTALVVGSALWPGLRGFASPTYLIVTALLGIWFVGRALAFARAQSRDAAAKRLFHASILWLPLQLGALVVDRFVFVTASFSP
ncbi:MAG: protoheme IX farnesyltransferase [Verrucomicrobia bacterium]|nr:protoheme IX farnesyltransferase [Verrucomicrobiota bacterium]